MLCRKGIKPSLAPHDNKVWVPIYVFLNVVVGLCPHLLPVSEETASPSDDAKLDHGGVLHLSPHIIFRYRIHEGRLVFLPPLKSRAKFSIVFFSENETQKLVVHFCCQVNSLLLSWV